jgi:hypothetical protein
MMKKRVQFRSWPAFSVLTTFFWCGSFVCAQSAPAQNPSTQNPAAQSPSTQDHDNVRHADDRDTTREELANFDRFLDSHRETAEQLRKNPSLADNQQFLKEHPELQAYLQDHPAVREELKNNPNAFMQEGARYDRREDETNRGGRPRDFDHNHSASFGEFLGAHANISEQLSKDPSLAKRDDYLQDHPELRNYLDAHPEVRQDLMTDPQNFMKSAQQFNNNGQAVKPTTAIPTAQMPEPKPKQQ